MTKTQRRLARKLSFPIIALLMMTATMAVAGSRNDAPTSTYAR